MNEHFIWLVNYCNFLGPISKGRLMASQGYIRFVPSHGRKDLCLLHSAHTRGLTRRARSLIDSHNVEPKGCRVCLTRGTKLVGSA